TYVLPWRDVLNVGPVPALPAAQLRLARARFLAERYGQTVSAVGAELRDRDRTLLGHIGRYMLWFDADLYDQLQLIQILAALRLNGIAAGSIRLINPGEMIGRAHFGGLGELSPAELAELVSDAVTLVSGTLADLAAGREPLLKLVPPASRPAVSTEVALTGAGRRVLKSSDRYAGKDRWIGGVHLAPGSPSWRYDDRLETLVATQ